MEGKESLKGKSFLTMIKSVWQGTPSNFYQYPFPFTRFHSLNGQENQVIRKAVIPQWLYNPMYGQPRGVNVLELRDWANTEFVRMCVDTLVNEVASVPWTVRVKEGYDEDPEMLEKARNFFLYPNANGESLEHILRQFVRDLLELDAGVIVKNFSPSGELKEIVARDGGTFVLNYDFTGFKPGPDDLDENGERIPAYYQYSFSAPTMKPIPFYAEEVVYAMLHPRTYSVYGQSPVEVIKDRTLTYLLRSMSYNADFFAKNAIPDGILSIKGMDEDSFERFRQYWQEKVKGQDHSLPIVDGEVDFKTFNISSREMEFLNGQRWFANLVFAVFKLNPNELGFTGDVGSKNIGESQERITTKKAVKPILDLIERKFNNEIIPYLYISSGEYVTQDVVKSISVEFKFLLDDRDREQRQLAKDKLELELGVSTINEVRQRQGREPVWWGDEPVFMQNDLPLLSLNENKGEKRIRIKKYVPKVSFYDRPEERLTMIRAEKKMERILSKMFSEARKEAVETVRMNKSFFGKKNKGLLDSFERVVKQVEQAFVRVFNLHEPEITVLVKMSYDTGREQVEKVLDMNLPITKNSLDIQDAVRQNVLEHVKSDLDGFKKDIIRILTDGVTNRKSVTEISKEISQRTGVAKARAKVIARTEVNRVFNQAHLNAYEDSGEVIGKEWVTAEDDRVRPSHARLHGKRLKLDEYFEVDGKRVLAPPLDPNCRCSIIPILKGEEI